MEFQILGSVDLIDAEGRARPLAPQARVLLAVLLVHANETVSTDALIDALWAERAPATASKVVQQRVSELRRALGEDSSLLDTRPGGYRVVVGPDKFDAARFEGLLETARAVALEDRHDDAIAAYDDALGCWRGRPLDDVADREFARAETARLDELKIVATEERVDSCLAMGRHRELVPLLKNLIAAHPLRERLTAQLMLALYRSDRQAGALRAYEALREILVESVGIDPSPGLRELEADILAQDGGLDLVTAETWRLAAVPVPLSSFVGREAILTGLEEDLAQHRLVTLTGVGGSGKTRLAVEFARLARGPSCFVDLALITDPDLVWRALGDSLSLRAQPGEPVEATVIAALASRELLIVLDNCEHVLAACAAVTETLLGNADRVRIVATSRESFAIPGEVVRVVPPLDVPHGETDEDSSAESVRLFVDRAAEAVSGFALTDENRAAVTDLCRRLDGIPLALELAASSVVVLEPQQIADRLFEGFDLMIDPGRRPPRQHTLGAAIAWSYELLSEAERDLFRRLSVFPGPFEIEAVEEVCGAEGSDGVPTVLLVGRLVRKSMVMREQPRDGVAHYRLLDTLRRHGAARLDELGTSRSNHDAFFRRALRLAVEFAEAGHVDGATQESAAASIHASYHQCRAALDWAIPNQPEAAARMIAALSLYWVRADMFTEGLSYIEQVLTVRESLPDVSVAAILASGAALHAEEGDSPRAIEMARRSLAEFERLSDDHGVARARLALGRALSNTGDYGEAIEHLEWALHWFSSSGHSLRLTALRAIAFVEMYRGDYERAEQVLNEALTDAVDHERPYNEAKALWMLGAVERDRGRLTEAFGYCEQALVIFIRLDDRSAIAHTRSTLGDIAKLSGEIDRALELYRVAYRDLVDIGDRRCGASSLKNMADIIRATDPRAASRHYVAALDQRHAIGDRAGVAECLEGLASTALQTNEVERATTMLAHAAVLRHHTGAQIAEAERTAAERDLASLRDALGPKQFSATWRKGQTMSLEAAVNLAHRCPD